MLSRHSLTFFLIKIFFPPKSKEQIEVMGSNIVSATFFFFFTKKYNFCNGHSYISGRKGSHDGESILPGIEIPSLFMNSKSNYISVYN